MSQNSLPDIKLFEGLTVQQCILLSRIFHPYNSGAGEVLFNQGDPADFLYILYDGEVLIQFKPDDGPEIEVARIVPEGVIGWSALIRNPAYTCSAVCLKDSRMIRARGDDLRGLSEEDTKTGIIILDRLMVMVHQRFQNQHSQIYNILGQALRLDLSRERT